MWEGKLSVWSTASIIPSYLEWKVYMFSCKRWSTGCSVSGWNSSYFSGSRGAEKLLSMDQSTILSQFCPPRRPHNLTLSTFIWVVRFEPFDMNSNTEKSYETKHGSEKWMSGRSLIILVITETHEEFQAITRWTVDVLSRKCSRCEIKSLFAVKAQKHLKHQIHSVTMTDSRLDHSLVL